MDAYLATVHSGIKGRDSYILTPIMVFARHEDAAVDAACKAVAAQMRRDGLEPTHGDPHPVKAEKLTDDDLLKLMDVATLRGLAKDGPRYRLTMTGGLLTTPSAHEFYTVEFALDYAASLVGRKDWETFDPPIDGMLYRKHDDDMIAVICRIG